MSHYCYIIYSPSLDSYYIGETEDLEERLKQHRDGLFRQSFTRRSSDWELFFTIECRDRIQARKIEAHIKRMRTRKYMIDLKEYSGISKRLLDLYL